MAQDKDDRPIAAIKKTSETGDEAMKRTPGAQSRSAHGNRHTTGMED